jgi:hypothetical protein
VVNEIAYERAKWLLLSWKTTVYFFTKEKSYGYCWCCTWPPQRSNHKRYVDPFCKLTKAIPLYASRSLRLSLHQKEPFWMWFRSLPSL